MCLLKYMCFSHISLLCIPEHLADYHQIYRGFSFLYVCVCVCVCVCICMCFSNNFFFNYLFFLEDNLFTTLWWPLSHIYMDQSQVHMCPPILKLPSTSLPTPSLCFVPEHWLWVLCFMHWTCTGHLFYIW